MVLFGLCVLSGCDSSVNEPKKPMMEEPTVSVGSSVIEEPIVDEPVSEVPIVDEPVSEVPIVDEPVIENPIVEKPVLEEPIVVEKSVIKDFGNYTVSLFDTMLKDEKQVEENFCISPFSLEQALLMVSVGAGEDTVSQKELFSFLNKDINLSNEELKNLFNKIEKNITKDFSIPIINDCAVMIFYGLLRSKVNKMKNKY